MTITNSGTVSWSNTPAVQLDLNISPEFKQLQEEVAYLSKIIGTILYENPEVLQKYANVKQAFEEYCLFRDLVVNKDLK